MVASCASLTEPSCRLLSSDKILAAIFVQSARLNSALKGVSKLKSSKTDEEYQL